jgi:hypothetical protein
MSEWIVYQCRGLDSRKPFQTLLEFYFQVIDILNDLVIGPLSA